MSAVKCHVHQLHLVRAVACLGVVLTHARYVLWSGGQAYLAHHPVAKWDWYEFPAFFLDLVTSLGPTRVFFFFILSGFFLQHSARQQLRVRSFLRHRFLRLYPAYLGATLMALAVFYLSLTFINPLLATGSPREFNGMLHTAAAAMSWQGLWHTLLFIGHNAPFAATPHFWSMQHEVVFCLLFPLYHRLAVRERAALAGVALLAGSLAGSLLVQAQVFFLLGMLFYDFFSRGYRLPFQLARWGYAGALGSLYLVTYAVAKQGLWLACVPMVLFASLLFNFILTQAIGVPRFCVFISKASYTIYLNHMWGLLLFYALLSRLTGELVFYSRWPYYCGALVAVLLSLPAYWLVDKRIAAYLSQLKQQAALPALPLPARPAAPRPALYQEEDYGNLLARPAAARRIHQLLAAAS